MLGAIHKLRTPKTSKFWPPLTPVLKNTLWPYPTPYPCTSVFSEHIFKIRWMWIDSKIRGKLIYEGIRACNDSTGCFGLICYSFVFISLIQGNHSSDINIFMIYFSKVYVLDYYDYHPTYKNKFLMVPLTHLSNRTYCKDSPFSEYRTKMYL